MCSDESHGSWGGDWNMTPEDVQLQWLRTAHFHIPQGPTQTFGRTLDWFLTSTLFSPTIPTIGDLPGTDHFPVTLTIPGDLPRTLGWRLRQAAPLDEEKLQALRTDPTPFAHLTTQPPTDWEEWTAQAESLLCRATDTEPPAHPSRGAAPAYVRQKLSRPQTSKSAIGGNKAIAALRLTQARLNRLNLLLLMGKADETEGAALRC